MTRYDYAVAGVVKVVDGDTVDLRLDVGLLLSYAGRFRLLGVDTPERGQDGFSAATEYVRAWLDSMVAQGKTLRVRTHKADSFGRWLVELYAADQDGLVHARLSDDLLAVGLAQPYVR